MLYWLLETNQAFVTNKLHFYAWQQVSFRSILAVLTALFVSLWFGPKIIRWLMKKKIGDHPEFDHASLNELTQNKSGTPTMGGLIMVAGILLGTLLWADLANPFIQKGIFLLIWLAVLGGIDDWLKLTAARTKRQRDGLKSWEKFLFQVGVAVLIAVNLDSDLANTEDGRLIWLPFIKSGYDLGFIGFAIITVLAITGTSNAVNLTDGMDGLAAGCIAIVAAVFMVLCYLASEFMSLQDQVTWASTLLLPQIRGAGECSILCGALFGASLGFLWFNCHPAQVFMGDVGSLPLGGVLGYVAVVTRNELLLCIIGGVFVIEALSVIMQVGYYKYSGGKRIFLCAPIHHHFHLKGWSEPQVVIRFWLMGIACAALALATLKLR